LVFTVTVTDAASAVAQRSYTLMIAAPSTTQLSRIRVDFEAPEGGQAPDPQWVNVTSPDVGTRFTTSLDQPAPWLTVTPARATAPARITLRADQQGLAAGTYRARVTVSGSATPIEVTLNVRAVLPKLDVSPTSLRMQGRFLARDTVQRALFIRNSGGGGLQPYTIRTVNGSSWISLTNLRGEPVTGGQAAVRFPDVVRVAVNVQSLQRGVYRDVIRVTSPAGNQDVPLTVFVAPEGPALELNPDGFQFEARQGNGVAVTRNLQVQNLGSGTLAWTASIERGGDWLAIGATQGTSTNETPGTLSVSVNPQRLAVRQYYGLIRVSAPGALNSPLLFPVALNVTDPSSPAQAAPSPSGLFFTAPERNATPLTQQVRVFTSSDTPLTFAAGTATEDSLGWLSVGNNTGPVATGRPGEVPVIVSAAGLPAGVYKGEVGVKLSDNTVRTVNITFVVTPQAAGTRSTAAGDSRSLAGCTPKELVATHTGLISNFSTAVGWPTPLTVRVTDDCAEPVNNASVVVNFSNGDPALSLTPNSSAQGLYTGTWTPGRVSDQLSVTARVTAAGLNPTTASLNGLTRESKAPVIAINGLLNNLFPQLGAAMAPGTVAALYGADLATLTQAPSTVPLPTTFQDTAVLIGGMEAPLFSISPGQVNVQIPAELAPNSSYQVLASVAGAVSVPERIFLSPVQPGLAAFPDGRVIAQHLDFTLVDSARPAVPGEVIVLYLVGMGETTPRVGTGQPSPLAPVNAQPQVTVDGRPATVLYAGLTPGGIGLYQINVQLPADAPGGEVRLQVSQGGVEANAVMVPVAGQ
jgi:uncharacterized protein (TIGR03437 family)